MLAASTVLMPTHIHIIYTASGDNHLIYQDDTEGEEKRMSLGQEDAEAIDAPNLGGEFVELAPLPSPAAATQAEAALAAGTIVPASAVVANVADEAPDVSEQGADVAHF